MELSHLYDEEDVPNELVISWNVKNSKKFVTDSTWCWDATNQHIMMIPREVEDEAGDITTTFFQVWVTNRNCHFQSGKYFDNLLLR